MKKALRILALISAVALADCTCGKQEIGGADAPTQIVITGQERHTDSDALTKAISAPTVKDTVLTVSDINTDYGDLICLKPDMARLKMEMVCGETP